jgi:hypothetical protein
MSVSPERADPSPARSKHGHRYGYHSREQKYPAEIEINGANPAQVNVGDQYVDLRATITARSQTRTSASNICDARHFRALP